MKFLLLLPVLFIMCSQITGPQGAVGPQGEAGTDGRDGKNGTNCPVNGTTIAESRVITRVNFKDTTMISYYMSVTEGGNHTTSYFTSDGKTRGYKTAEVWYDSQCRVTKVVSYSSTGAVTGTSNYTYQ